MANLVALKFQAGLHTEDNKAKGWQIGHAKYPDFNQVSLANRGNMDWCTYIDTVGIGMQYDKTCGHREYRIDSPVGEQCCVIAAPQAFATEALALFPGELTQLTPAEFEDFYDNKAHAHEPVEKVDQLVLDAIAVKESLAIPVPEKADAIDPKTETPGIRENKNKTWAKRKLVGGHAVI